MRPRKSTWIWLDTLVVAEVLAWILGRTQGDDGCLSLAAHAVALSAALVLAWRITTFLFRLIVRRASLRLAFSYFLIGIVPIPLLAALLSVASYIVAHQFIATRLRREITAIGVSALSSSPAPSRVTLTPEGTVAASGLSWLPAGAAAGWLQGLERPGFLEADDRLWLAVPDGARAVRLSDLSDPQGPWVQRLADATDDEARLFVGESSNPDSGFSIRTPEENEPGGFRAGARDRTSASPSRRPRKAPAEAKGIWNGEWIHAFYLETLLNAADAEKKTGHNVAILGAITSPRVVTDQIFSQGVAGIANVFWVVLVVIGSLLLAVYLVALAIAFVLGGSIARNVNKLTGAARAVSRGDFSVRVHSKSKDQIGDLARSFDAMAESIQQLLFETARKERLESDVAIARTIHRKLLPPVEAGLPGLSVRQYFEPVAEIGGDYYDFLPMPDGRTALALGDVLRPRSSHGTPGRDGQGRPLHAARGRPPRRRALRTPERGDPPFDGSAPLHDAVSRRLRRRRAPRDPDQRRPARALSDLRGKGGVALPPRVSAGPVSGQDVPVAGGDVSRPAISSSSIRTA